MLLGVRPPAVDAFAQASLQKLFPLRWTVDETHACFTVRDANGQALAYTYFEDEAGRRASAKLLTHDEARRIATNIVKLPYGGAKA